MQGRVPLGDICPHCRQRCLGAWRKFALGSGQQRCRSCRRAVGIAWWWGLAFSCLAGLVCLLAGIAALQWQPLAARVGLFAFPMGFAAAAVALMLSYWRLVPLQSRED